MLKFDYKENKEVQYHILYHQVACVLGPFNDSSINYLLVADYRQQNVYQLQPDTGELRSLFNDSIFTVAFALDPSRKMVYLAFAEDRSSGRPPGIRKRSFDGNTNSIIYYALSSVLLHHINFTMNFFFGFYRASEYCC